MDEEKGKILKFERPSRARDLTVDDMETAGVEAEIEFARLLSEASEDGEDEMMLDLLSVLTPLPPMDE